MLRVVSRISGFGFYYLRILEIFPPASWKAAGWGRVESSERDLGNFPDVAELGSYDDRHLVTTQTFKVKFQSLISEK